MEVWDKMYVSLTNIQLSLFNNQIETSEFQIQISAYKSRYLYLNTDTYLNVNTDICILM